MGRREVQALGAVVKLLWQVTSSLIFVIPVGAGGGIAADATLYCHRNAQAPASAGATEQLDNTL